MLPVIALVGRPNVGKSTLFNYLTRSRDALVADYPGLTRDRQYGFGKRGDTPFMVVDTGGLTGEQNIIDTQIARQVDLAIDEADMVWFLVDARDGLTPADETIAMDLRKRGKTVALLVNKVDGVDERLVGSDFFALGLGEPHNIAAAHGRGIQHALDYTLEAYASDEEFMQARQERLEDRYPGIRVAIIGRPNVGKSTLINRLIGEERVVASEVAGTTRDSVFVPFEKNGKPYTLIDTAGVRRRAKIDEAIEKFSVIKTLQAIDAANVVVGLVDAHEGIAEQDARLLGLALERGRALVLAINKWDGLNDDIKETLARQLDVKLPFLEFAERHHISALHGTGVGLLFESIEHAYESAIADLSTTELTKALETAVMRHQPPIVRGRRIKLRYAHQGGSNPPVIVVHGNQTDRVPKTYKRYLMNHFRRVFQLDGTPVRIEFRTGDNPYKDRKNTLSDRQIKKKKRLVRHIKKRSR